MVSDGTELFTNDQPNEYLLSLTLHFSEWSAMEQNCSRMINQTKEMEKKLALTEAQNKQSETIAHQLGAKLAATQAQKCTLETDFKVRTCDQLVHISLLGVNPINWFRLH